MPKKPALTSHQAVVNAAKGKHPVTPGLRYISNGTGTGRWMGYYMIGGKERAVALGHFPERRLKDAIAEHIENRAGLRAGRHPKEAKAKMDEIQTQTVEQVVRDAYASFAGGWKNGGARNGFMPKMEKYVFPTIGNLPMSAINGRILSELMFNEDYDPKRDDPREKFRVWHKQHPTMHKVLIHMSKVIGWAAATGIEVDRMAVKDARKILGKTSYRPTKHPSMDWENVPPYFMGMSGSMSDLAQKFYILTAVRTMNAASARWDQIRGNTWVLSDKDMKREAKHVVPLCPQAMAILDQATRFYDDPEDRTGFIFRNPGAWVTGHVSANNWSKKFRDAGIPATAHGFRRSFKNWGMINRIAPEIELEDCLHHKVRGETSEAYVDELSERYRPIYEAWATFLTGAGAQLSVVKDSGG